VEAIADGRRVATAILTELELKPAPFPVEVVSAPSLPLSELHKRRGQLAEAAVQPLTSSLCSSETERCLACDLLCNRCVDVCPNRANISLDLEQDTLFQDRFQIIHLEALCNECGNCVTFCPHDGAPWLEKPTLFSTAAAFDSSSTSGFLLLNTGEDGSSHFRVRLDKVVIEVTLQQDGSLIETESISALLSQVQGKQLLRLLQLLHSEYEYLLPLSEY
jgi:putative selenate reductase